MVENKWQGQKWEELASEAQTGLRGQGAVVEAMRRLTDRLDAFSKSSDIYAKGMLRLTITTLWLYHCHGFAHDRSGDGGDPSMEVTPWPPHHRFRFMRWPRLPRKGGNASRSRRPR